MLNVRKILEPSLKDTLVHRMDPRAKLIALTSVSILCLLIDKPEILMALFGLSLLGYPLARIPIRNIKILAVLLLLLVWGTIYSQSLFYQEHPRTILFTILAEDSLGMHWEGLHVFREGIEYGAIQSMRFATTTSLALLFYWTTNPSAMLSGLILLKVPYGLAFMAITSLRFIPLLISEAITVLRAQRLKGYSPFRMTNWIRTLFLALVPILANCIRRSAKLAVSVEGRSFQPDGSRTYLKGARLGFRPVDRLLLVCSLTVLPVFVFKLLYWLYANNFYYNPQFRWVYEIAANYI
ncbi:energy-coupling factor transporter transmembrane component T family protein [Desulfosarcina ovata]|uniref:Energy-coupling factor transporter transmembrane protein EcfT n=2 Tax=Desulfosarcina ovata TaxID=83564 RepID=A0A5K8A9E2_9BACT|nr:energy-coupling factor transporter transmembrane component T [Desulfosarcina ovata]BBO81949.1 energy-coupling factor transporter transmembrane protein EcfT [Desulfosarcina ovata subsp. sediminis]BBO89167.1 energy-coupling factor transporter transmembrane protein EcfT [Desulfosarcina ovata subsp. ovata]